MDINNPRPRRVYDAALNPNFEAQYRRQQAQLNSVGYTQQPIVSQEAKDPSPAPLSSDTPKN